MGPPAPPVPGGDSSNVQGECHECASPEHASAVPGILGYPVPAMAKRRRQEARRARASQAALDRRIDDRTAVDWRVWGIGGLAVVAVLIGIVAVAVASAGSQQTVGTLVADAGALHISEGQPGSGYTSVPPTSGQHWSSAASPTSWGVHEAAVPQERALHNLEHGGIVIWYQPARLSGEAIGQLEDWGRGQTQREQYKVLVSPWAGQSFEAAIAVTARRYLLYQETLDLDEIEAFLAAHYQGPLAPEPNAGPGRPAV
jgi:hypothetical protein